MFLFNLNDRNVQRLPGQGAELSLVWAPRGLAWLCWSPCRHPLQGKTEGSAPTWPRGTRAQQLRPRQLPRRASNVQDSLEGFLQNRPTFRLSAGFPEETSSAPAMVRQPPERYQRQSKSPARPWQCAVTPSGCTALPFSEGIFLYVSVKMISILKSSDTLLLGDGGIVVNRLLSHECLRDQS